jgi:hypothetical protein
VIVSDLGGCTPQRFLAQLHAPKRALDLILGGDLRKFTRQLTAHPLSCGPSQTFFDVGAVCNVNERLPSQARSDLTSTL